MYGWAWKEGSSSCVRSGDIPVSAAWEVMVLSEVVEATEAERERSPEEG